MSSTLTRAISPASPDHTCTVHWRVSDLYSASRWGFGGYRSSQSATFGYASAFAIACSFVRFAPGADGTNGVSMIRPRLSYTGPVESAASAGPAAASPTASATRTTPAVARISAF